MLHQKKKAMLILIVIVLMLSCFSGCFHKTGKEMQTLYFEDGSVYLKDVDKKLSLKVEGSGNIRANDKTGNAIEYAFNNGILSFPNLKEGEEYRVRLDEGMLFSDYDTSEIEFTVSAPEVEKYELKENVRTAKKKAEVEDGRMKSKEKYSVGDIVILNQKEAYQITGIESDGSYSIVVPEPNEVYESIEINKTYSGKDLKVTINEEVKDAMANDLKNRLSCSLSAGQGFQGLIGEGVDLKPKIECKYKSGKLTIKFESAFVLDDLKFKIIFSLKAKPSVSYEISTADNRHEFAVNLEGESFNVSIEGGLGGNKESVKELTEFVKKEYQDLIMKTIMDYECSLLEFEIPTAIPLLNLVWQLKIKSEIKGDVKIRWTLNGKFNITTGAKTDDNGLIRFFSTVDKVIDTYTTVYGKLEAKIGIGMQFDALILFSSIGKVEGMLYPFKLEAYGSISRENKSKADIQTKGYLKFAPTIELSGQLTLGKTIFTKGFVIKGTYEKELFKWTLGNEKVLIDIQTDKYSYLALGRDDFKLPVIKCTLYRLKDNIEEYSTLKYDEAKATVDGKEVEIKDGCIQLPEGEGKHTVVITYMGSNVSFDVEYRDLTINSLMLNYFAPQIRVVNKFWNSYMKENIIKKYDFKLVCYKEEDGAIVYVDNNYMKDYEFGKYSYNSEIIYKNNPFERTLISRNYVDSFIGESGFALYSSETKSLRVYRLNKQDDSSVVYDLLEIEPIMSQHWAGGAKHIEGLDYRYCRAEFDIASLQQWKISCRKTDYYERSYDFHPMDKETRKNVSPRVSEETFEALQ